MVIGKYLPSIKRRSKSVTAATASRGNGKSSLFLFTFLRSGDLFRNPHPLPYKSPNKCGAKVSFQESGASKYVARPKSQSPGWYSGSSIESIVALS